jgi:hypothetical protein
MKEVVKILRKNHDNKKFDNIRSGGIYYEILLRTLASVRKSV